MAGMGGSNSSSPAARALPPPPRRLWLAPLLVGLCFGLGYGITSRLLDLSWSGLVRLGHSFDLRPLPGTSLESLRQRYGAERQSIRADLDRAEREAEARKAEQLARQQAELDRQRLQQAEPALGPGNEPAAEATPELPSAWQSPAAQPAPAPFQPPASRPSPPQKPAAPSSPPKPAAAIPAAPLPPPLPSPVSP